MVLNTLARIAVGLAHLAGLVVAILLWVRRKGTAPMLATAAFALLFLLDIGGALRSGAIEQPLLRAFGTPRSLPWVLGGLNCCCSFLDVVAIVLLIVALWQALSGGAEAEEETVSEG